MISVNTITLAAPQVASPTPVTTTIFTNGISVTANVAGRTLANIYITSDQTNLNLLSFITSLGLYNPGKTIANVTILSNVVVGSKSATTSALTVHGFKLGDVVSIYNYGNILGKGGDGASVTTFGTLASMRKGIRGGNGGTALEASYITSLFNYGTIAGGGGGGSGITAFSQSNLAFVFNLANSPLTLQKAAIYSDYTKVVGLPAPKFDGSIGVFGYKIAMTSPETRYIQSSNTIDLSSCEVLTYYATEGGPDFITGGWGDKTEANAGGIEDEGLKLEYSTDGVTWKQLDFISSGRGLATWQRRDVILANYPAARTSVYLRFSQWRQGDVGTITRDTWAFSGVFVERGFAVMGAPGGGGAGYVVGTAGNNLSANIIKGNSGTLTSGGVGGYYSSGTGNVIGGSGGSLGSSGSSPSGSISGIVIGGGRGGNAIVGNAFISFRNAGTILGNLVM